MIEGATTLQSISFAAASRLRHPGLLARRVPLGGDFLALREELHCAIACDNRIALMNANALPAQRAPVMSRSPNLEMLEPPNEKGSRGTGTPMLTPTCARIREPFVDAEAKRRQTMPTEKRFENQSAVPPLLV